MCHPVFARVCMVGLVLCAASPVIAQQLATAPDCSDCKPGEWRVSDEVTVKSGDYVFQSDPGCDFEPADRSNRIIRLILDGLLGPISVAGPIIDVLEKGAVKLAANTGGELSKLLVPVGDRKATCVVRPVVVPVGAEVTRVRFSARETDGDLQVCNVERDCPIGWSKWQAGEHKDNVMANVLTATFKNWSHNRTRVGQFIVYFVPPDGWKPE